MLMDLNHDFMKESAGQHFHVYLDTSYKPAKKNLTSLLVVLLTG